MENRPDSMMARRAIVGALVLLHTLALTSAFAPSGGLLQLRPTKGR